MPSATALSDDHVDQLLKKVYKTRDWDFLSYRLFNNITIYIILLTHCRSKNTEGATLRVWSYGCESVMDGKCLFSVVQGIKPEQIKRIVFVTGGSVLFASDYREGGVA